MSSRISQLAETIEQNTATIEKYLQSKGIPSPSLGYDAPKALATTGDAEALRIQTISAANELSDLLKGPAELIRYDWTEHASLRLILRLGIPSMVPLGSDSQVSFSELAQRTALPERDVRRILRHGMCRHIFTEPRKGYVSHTAISRLLREDEQQVAIASTVADVLEPALLHTADAVQKFPGSEEARESAFSLVNSPGKSMWEIFSENPEMARRFGVYIGESGLNESVLSGVDWTGVIVDIGGSHGIAMIDILDKCPKGVDKVIIQDLPDVVAEGERKAPLHLLKSGKLQFQSHDFFKPQQQQADIFFFRWILHNWSNKYSIRILRNVIPTMRPGCRIIINDFILPEPNTLSPPLERAARNIDMTMLSLLNATERDREDWYELFEAADPRFKIQSITMTPPGLLGIIEVVWEG